MRADWEERYQRQLLLTEIGRAGQEQLARASVLVIGAGGLGSPVLLYLAAAGVGHIGIADGDSVSLSNLNRQVLYGTEDVDKPKAQCAAQALSRLDNALDVRAIPFMLNDENAKKIVTGYDAAVFCLDSIASRRIANRACVEAGVPFVEAGVNSFSGVVVTVIPGETACYDCLYNDVQPISETVPVLGAMAGLIGSMQALCVVRLLLGQQDPSRGALLFMDGKNMTIERIPIQKNPACPVCGGS